MFFFLRIDGVSCFVFMFLFDIKYKVLDGRGFVFEIGFVYEVLVF